MVKLLIVKALQSGNVEAALMSASKLSDQYTNWDAVHELYSVITSKGRNPRIGAIEKMVGHNIITVAEAAKLLS